MFLLLLLLAALEAMFCLFCARRKSANVHFLASMSLVGVPASARELLLPHALVSHPAVSLEGNDQPHFVHLHLPEGVLTSRC